MKKYKYFTLSELIAANKIAVNRNYNRQLVDEINQLPKDTLFPITFTMVHEHASGIRVDPHVRCMIGMPGGTAMIDCDFDLFESLNEVDVG